MKNLEQQFSEDLLITHSSKSVREYSDPIPVDLLIDIFSRVPAKSIIRFRCVSKFWSSILGRPDFTELFLTKSLTRPRLLFLLEFKKELSVFSSPQPHQDPDEDSCLVATHYTDYTKHILSEVGTPLGGFISFDSRICNPVTGQSITLPKRIAKSYFGYDPINKQIKVLLLRLTFSFSSDSVNIHHQFLILDETGNRLWRTIQDSTFPHIPRDDEIYINGVLYYTTTDTSNNLGVVCFDFVSEKFSFIHIDQGMLYRGHYWILFNYKGKLGAHQYIGRHREELILWVLEDAEKHQWSKSIYRLPPLCNEINNKTKIVGMTGAGELVFSPHCPTEPFYIFYYNIERNTVTRVRIQGFEKFNHPLIKVRTFLDYVENVKLM